MPKYIVDGSDLTSVANTIRTKGGTSGSLSFPNGWNSAISAIGGGGSSDFSTAEVTITDASSYSGDYTCYCPHFYDDEIYAYIDFLDMGGNISAVLYKGKCMLTIPIREPVRVTNVTGDIEISGGNAIISGPGTITIGDGGGSN